MHSRLAGEAALDCVGDRARQAPDSPKIRFAIGSPRRGSGEVGLAIRQPRNPRSRVVQPLCYKRRRYHADDDANGDTHLESILLVFKIVATQSSTDAIGTCPYRASICRRSFSFSLQKDSRISVSGSRRVLILIVKGLV